MKRILTVVLVSVSMLSCKQDEMDDLAKAQKCLDEVSQDSPTDADACLAPIEKYTSQQANILKCSIHMTSGGLVESKMVAAYKLVDQDSNVNREAAFMSALALNKPNVNAGYDKAVKADEYCQLTGVPGLQYISGVVKMGSFMAKTISAYNGSINFDDPNAVAGAVGDLVDKCSANPRDSACPSDLSAIGTTATVLADSYCGSDSADAEVCENINAAVDSAGSDPSDIGRALFCYLDNKKYNSSTKDCVP